jgi:SOS-response transcriptional repressor LexA
MSSDMDINKIRLTNLDALIAEAGGKTRLAQRAKIQPKYLSQVHTPAHFANDPSIDPSALRYIGSKVCRKLEAAQNKPLGWMDQQHDIPEGALGEPSHRVAMLTWAEAARIRLMDVRELLEKDATIYVGNAGTRLYGLIVRDDTMFDPTSQLAFKEGSRLIIDPDRHAQRGNFVIVKFADQEEPMLRQLVHDGRRPLLKPLNRSYESYPLPEDGEILGVVISIQVDLPLEG